MSLKINLTKEFITSLFLSIIFAISGRISVNIYSIPITAVTFSILLSTLIFNKRIVLTAVVIYLLEGLSGFGVFANGSSWASIFGPNLGYLLSMLLIVELATKIKDHNFATKIFLSIIILLTACFLGTLYLAIFIPIKIALYTGFYIFIPVEIIKSVLAVSISTKK